MQALNKYVEEKNTWQILFSGAKLLTLDTASGRKAIALQLDSDLSPENLHCDGEITARQAQAKYKMYSRVVVELEAYCKANTLTMPQVEELY